MRIKFEGREWPMPRSKGELIRLAGRVLGFNELPGKIEQHLEEGAFVSGAIYPVNKRGVLDCLREARSYLRKHAGLGGSPSPRTLSSELRVPRALLPEGESIRARLFSEHVAALARTQPELLRVRATLLSGHLLRPDQLLGFLASPAIQLLPASYFEAMGAPLLDHEASFFDIEHTEASKTGITTGMRVSWSGQSKDLLCPEWWFEPRRRVPAVKPDGYLIWYPTRRWSVLDEIGEAADALVRLHPWELEDAVAFLLTDKTPHVRPVSIRNSAHWTPDYQRGLITLRIEPWVPAHHVYAIYQHAQEKQFAGTPKPCAVEKLELHEFVTKRRSSGDSKPSMPQLMREWNRSHPNHRYSDYRSFSKDYDRAGQWISKQVIFPQYRMLGKRALESASTATTEASEPAPAPQD